MDKIIFIAVEVITCCFLFWRMIRAINAESEDEAFYALAFTAVLSLIIIEVILMVRLGPYTR